MLLFQKFRLDVTKNGSNNAYFNIMKQLRDLDAHFPYFVETKMYGLNILEGKINTSP